MYKFIIKISVFIIFIILIFISNVNANEYLINNLIYSSYILGSNKYDNYVYKMILDKNGYPIISGKTNDINFPFSPNSYKNKLDSNSNQKNINSILMRINKDNYKIINSTSLGIWSYYWGSNMICDNENNIYFNINNNDNTDFIPKYNLNLNNNVLLLKTDSGMTKIITSSCFGNNKSENKGKMQVHDLTLDKLGNVVIIGTCDTAGIFTTSNSFKPSIKISRINAFIAKLTPNLDSIIFSTYFNDGFESSGNNAVTDYILNKVSINNLNEIVVIGYRKASNNSKIDDSEIDIPNLKVQENIIERFVAKLSEDGATLKGYIINSTSNSTSFINTDLKISSDDNIYILGNNHKSTNYYEYYGYLSDFNINWKQTSYIHCFNNKLDSFVYGTYFSKDSCELYSEHLEISKNGEIYIAGYFLGGVKNGNAKLFTPPLTKGHFTFDWLDVNDYCINLNIPQNGSFISVFDKKLIQLQYSTTFGGSDCVTINNIKLDNDDNMYIIGHAAGAIYFPITENALWKTYYPYNSFLAKLSNLKDQVSVDGFKIAPSNIFPNPATDYLNIAFESIKEGLGTIEIIDLLGIKVCSFETYINEGINSIKYSELYNLPTASYTVKVTINNEIVSIGKFIKQ